MNNIHFDTLWYSQNPRLSRGLEEALEGLHAGTHLKMHRKIFHLHHSHCCPQVGKVAFTARHSENNFWLLFASLIALNAKAFLLSPAKPEVFSDAKAYNKNIRRKIFRFYDGYGADGGSRTHATVSCPKAFRVNLWKGNMVITKADTGWFVRWFWTMCVGIILLHNKKTM